MILAAGLGTRLRPLTDRTPKALIEVGGVTMLERIARRLVDAGANRIIINVHHHADAIERFAKLLSLDLGAKILLSREEEGPLETGGGLLHAAPLFRQETPFYLHNIDIITNFDLAAIYEAHRARGALATLAVNRRETSRFLLFDDGGLYGRADQSMGLVETIRAASGGSERIAFAGVHVVSPEIFGLITEQRIFSILDLYLRLAAEGRRILPYDVSGASWLEIGTPERLAKARGSLPG